MHIDIEIKPYHSLKLIQSDFNFKENFFEKNNSDLIGSKLTISGNNEDLKQLLTDLKIEIEEAKDQSSYCCHYHLYKRDFKSNKHSDNLFLLVKFWTNMGFKVHFEIDQDNIVLYAN